MILELVTESLQSFLFVPEIIALEPVSFPLVSLQDDEAWRFEKVTLILFIWSKIFAAAVRTR